MKRTRLISTVSLFLLLLVNMANAGITLPAIISSNMVLQRDAKVVLWGWADAQEEITIKVSWMINPLVVTADNQGNWHVELNTNLSKEPQSINFLSDESNITLENILFGEVWLCS